MSCLQFPLHRVTAVQVMMFSYLACVCPPSRCFTKSLCFICFGQHYQWVYYDGVIIVPTLILFFLPFLFVPQEEVAKNLLAEFNLGCDAHRTEHVYRVYVSTFLGFGGNAARQKYEESLIRNSATRNK